MVRELITIQVGQCGNQIGCKFWDLALGEHSESWARRRKQAQRRKKKTTSTSTTTTTSTSTTEEGGGRPEYDDALSSFFRNVDTRSGTGLEVGSPVAALKARAVLVDMEEGVVSSVLRSPLGPLFDASQTITSDSGSGNNWAHGYAGYGPQYRESLLEGIRVQAEDCDSLQSFFSLHSMGGGTGSGLGTYILDLLHDEYPNVYRFTTAVFPSPDDDVITSPYNAILASAHLVDHADAVLPLENQSLIDILARIDSSRGSGRRKHASAITDDWNSVHGGGGQGASSSSSSSSSRAGSGEREARRRAFDKMNTIGARLLLNLTASMRFEGSLNVDLNEITMNLVPFPKLHFLLSSLSPLYSLADVAVPPRALNQMFSDAFSPEYQLARVDPRVGTYLACGLMVRGNVLMSDIRRNIDRMKPRLNFSYWNQEGWKVGLCGSPPIGQERSLLCLANHTGMESMFDAARARFLQLYSRKVYVHHYTDFIEMDAFDTALDTIDCLISDYADLHAAPAPTSVSSLRVASTF